MNQKILTTHQLTIGYMPPRRPPAIIAGPITVALHAGELACLLGPNGAGKSTLIRTLAGMQKPLDGRVLLLGEDVHHLAADDLARRLSVVLTERPPAGLLTGYELVALGRHPYTGWLGRLTPADEAVVRWAVEAVGAADVAARPVSELSDGQRQKLMIARALTQEPAAILLDEPTAFLDLPHRVEIMRLLRRLARETGRAILLSTHDLDLALRTADRLWLMPAGGPLQSGAPEDLILNGAFEASFRTEGVTFDVQTGAFRVQDGARGRIYVNGDGAATIWTRRALERAGFTISANGGPVLARVEVRPNGSGASWRLHRNDRSSEHFSIADLVAALEPGEAQ